MPNNDQRRSSLRDQQVDLTRDLIMRAFQGLLQNDHPDAITFPQVAEAAGVSLRTVYRYFPTRTDLLQSAAAWFARVHGRRALGRPADGARPGGRDRPSWAVSSTSTRTSSGRWPTTSSRSRAAPRSPRRSPRCRATSRRTRRGARRRSSPTSAPGARGSCCTTTTALAGDEIVATLDWAATTLLEDVRRRNDGCCNFAAAQVPGGGQSRRRSPPRGSLVRVPRICMPLEALAFELGEAGCRWWRG